MHSLKLKSGPALKYASGLEIEIKTDGKGRIAGYGSTFGGDPDAYGDIIAPGAFAKTLSREPLPKMLWQHQRDRPIGRWIAAREDNKGLYLEGVLNLKTTAGKDAFEHLASGDVDGLSIGYREVRAKPDGNARLLQELILLEVSVVTWPANVSATVETVKNIASKSELVDLLREVGLPKTAAARVAAGGWPALAGADHQQKATDLAAIIDAATAELRKL